MAKPFEITAATNTVALDNKREGLATFTVRNVTRRRVRAVAKLVTLPPESAARDWIGIVPADAGGTPSTTDVRDFAIDAAQQYQVQVKAPQAAPPGSYGFRLIVADEINPDENFTQSPDVTFTVLEPPAPEPRRLPRWLIPLIVVVVLLVGGVIALIIAEQNRQAAEALAATQTLEAARLTADAATANAIVNATATAVAEANQTATAAAATQTAFNRYVGTWEPLVANPSAIRELSIADGGNNRYTVSYSSNCPPAGNVCFTSPQTFTISGVAYDPQRLIAAIQNTVITIEPTSDGRLLTRMIVNTVETTQVLRRVRRPFDSNLGIRVTMMPNVAEFLGSRNIDLNVFQLTPGS